MRLNGMLAPVDFDHEHRPNTDEIDDVWTDRDLPAESVALDLLSTQPVPKTQLGVGHVGAQPAGPLFA